MFLEARMRGAYLVKNISGKQIVSFTLGCVDAKKYKALVVMSLPRKDFSIDPGGSIGESIIDACYTEPYERCVIKSKLKLAVVSVAFEDKTSWSFSETGVGGAQASDDPNSVIREAEPLGRGSRVPIDKSEGVVKRKVVLCSE